MNRIPKPRARQRLTVALLAVTTLGSAGCVAFERETMVFVFPKGGKEVRALFLYEGVCVSGKTEADLKRAKEQLSQFVGEKEFCLGSNFFLHVNLAEYKNDSDGDRALKERMRGHLVIRNRGLFLNKEGKLCGWQTLTCKDGGKLVEELNQLLRVRMLEMSETQLADPTRRGSEIDEETLKLIQQACKAKHTWVQMEPGRFSLTVPMSAATSSNLKREFLGVNAAQKLRDALAKPFKPEADDAAGEKKLANWWSQQHHAAERLARGLAFLNDNPVSFEQRADRVTVSAGLGAGKPVRLLVKEFERSRSKLDEQLIEHAQTLKVPFKKDVSAEELIADFIKKSGQEK